ncbi:MAG TPA: PEP-utilizing enzyme, partial [Anaerolineae bacterium]|nr:PEP-utilizing enzyme [Anaerolineae bacterium]
NVHLSALRCEYARLDKEVQARIGAGHHDDLNTLPGTESLQQGIARFLERFGHLSDSGNDFSHRPWRESPDLVLQMIANHTPVEPAAAGKVQFQDLSMPAVRWPLFKSLYHRARHFRFYREAVSSLYTFGYGLFRDHFLALGEHLARRGIIAQRDDIFYLYLDQVREIVQAGHLAPDHRSVVKERMAEIDGARDLIPPGIVYGGQAPPLTPHEGRGFKGTPTSRGYYTGPARVARGIQDMGKVQKGDVLVVPYSDVGWTPLFTRAGAVIAESGGILSHSSIIAREYGIPAVVSVPGACQLADGTLVTVDGYRGDILIHEGEQAALGHEPGRDSSPVENRITENGGDRSCFSPGC